MTPLCPDILLLPRMLMKIINDPLLYKSSRKIFVISKEINMKQLGFLMILLLTQISFISVAHAGDFDWLHNLDVSAKADSSGFQYTLSTRFHIGNVEVKTVLSNVDKPSDAYMVFRLGELSHRPVTEVVKIYRANRHKGWGVIAKNLGIKPGSREFHALKRGHDLDGGTKSGSHAGKSKGKSAANKGNKNKGKK